MSEYRNNNLLNIFQSDYVKPVKGKAKSDVKKESADLNFKHGSESNLEEEKASNIETEKKLAITKPWFSRSEILKSENESFEKNPKPVASVSYDVRPHKKSSINPPIIHMILQIM